MPATSVSKWSILKKINHAFRWPIRIYYSAVGVTILGAVTIAVLTAAGVGDTENMKASAGMLFKLLGGEGFAGIAAILLFYNKALSFVSQSSAGTG